MKTQEEYQEAIELTPEQVKAFAALKRAVTRCRKTNIFFYQVLSSLGALNGNNVHDIGDDCYRGGDIEDPHCMQYLQYPTVETECSFADDNHFVFLHD